MIDTPLCNIYARDDASVTHNNIYARAGLLPPRNSNTMATRNERVIFTQCVVESCYSVELYCKCVYIPTDISSAYIFQFPSVFRWDIRSSQVTTIRRQGRSPKRGGDDGESSVVVPARRSSTMTACRRMLSQCLRRRTQ